MDALIRKYPYRQELLNSLGLKATDKEDKAVTFYYLQYEFIENRGVVITNFKEVDHGLLEDEFEEKFRETASH